MSEDSSARSAGTKRAKTRARLIDAAAELVAAQGFEATSLEDVAVRAGVTRGAIYGNFRNRDDLFLAVVAAKWRPVAPPFLRGVDFLTQMNAVADALVAEMPVRRAAAIGAASFQLYALTHPDMLARIAEANAAIYRQIEEGLVQAVPEAELPMAPDAFVRAMHALIDGLMLLHALTPDLIGETTIRAAIAAITRPGAPAVPTPGPDRL